MYTEDESLTSQAIASNFAKDVLKDNPCVKQPDKAYVLATIAALAAFESPLPTLFCGIATTDASSFYTITVKGYVKLIDDEAWYQTFMDESTRDKMLQNVIKSHTQMTEQGLLKVIHVQKVQLKTPAQSSVARRRKH